MLISQKLVHIFRGFYWHQENNSMITGLESNLDITFSMATFSHSRVIFTVSSIQSDWLILTPLQHGENSHNLSNMTVNLECWPIFHVIGTLRAGFSLVTKWFVSLVSLMVDLFYTPKPTTRQTSDANDFLNTKSHAREKPLFAGHVICRCHRQPLS